MALIDWAKNHIQEVKCRMLDPSLESLMWVVNIMPDFSGFSILQDKLKVPFWVIHSFLLMYVYGAGCAMYLVNNAKGFEEFIKCYINVSLLILIANISWWWVRNRATLRAVLKGIEESDRLAQRTETLRTKHQRDLRKIKIIILSFYCVVFFNESFIYLPHRVDVHHGYAMVPCVGMEDLDSTPYHEICMFILWAQEISIMICTVNYQTLLVLLVGHTAVMFKMLTHEMMSLNNYSDLEEHKVYVKNYLPVLIRRHTLTLDVFNNLQLLYSVPIGVDFGLNAICIALFFYIPFEDWLMFYPILLYCFLVFFMYCFLCQTMTDASESFETAVYSCGWENFSLKEKKLVYVMLIQAQKPVVLLAADIVPVNMYTFATTLQFMFKFTTVVKT